MDKDDDDADGGRVPIVRKHYTAFSSLRRTILGSTAVQALQHPGRARNILQPHLSRARYAVSLPCLPCPALPCPVSCLVCCHSCFECSQHSPQ
jgi:hypothetical protein